jgi:hypothetical protein
MKSLLRPCAAFVLTVVLATAALAGDISTTVVSPQSPTQPLTANGDISTTAMGQISTTAPASDSVFEAALNLVRGVLSLF